MSVLDNPFHGYSELTVTQPLGHGIRYQLLALNVQQAKCMTPPSWEQFTRYSLFNNIEQGTLKALYPPGNFVLEILRRGPKHYKNIMGVTMKDEGQNEFLSTMRGIWRNINYAAEKNYNFGNSLVVIILEAGNQFSWMYRSYWKSSLFDVLENRYKLYSKSAVEDALNYYTKRKKYRRYAFEDELETRKKRYYEDQEISRVVELSVRDKDIAVVFESRLAMGAADLYATSESSSEDPAMDVLLVVKAEHLNRLHSHLWLLYGFCIHFQPKIVFLIDMGTEPEKKCLIAIHEHLGKNKTTGGCCGEVTLRNVPWYDPLIGAQWFELKIGHIICKTFESCMGFIPALSNTFSAYRWEALTTQNCAVLKKYFQPFINPLELDWILMNVYAFAADRIMSEEIVQVGETRGYSLRFVKDAKALTEGVNKLVDLIIQKRKWINGSWFALIKVLKHFQLLRAIWCHSHQVMYRKALFAIQTFYMLSIMLVTWFSVGIFYYCYSKITKRIFAPENYYQDTDDKTWEKIQQTLSLISEVMQYLYLFFIVCIVLVSLATDVRNMKSFWKMLSVFFAVCGLFIFFGFLIIIGETNFQLNAFSTYEALALAIVMAIAIVYYWESIFLLFVSSLCYLLLIPTYINIFLVYAVCRTDDVSWQRSYRIQDEFTWKKTLFLVFFAACNILVGTERYVLHSTNGFFIELIEYIYLVGFIFLLIPVIGEVMYLTSYWVSQFFKCCRKSSIEQDLRHSQLMLDTIDDTQFPNLRR